MTAAIGTVGGMLLRSLEVVMWATFVGAMAAVGLCVLAIGVALLLTVVAAGGFVIGCLHVVGAD